MKHKISGKEKTILDVLREREIEHSAPCGGEGICGKCLIKATGSLAPPTPEEKHLLGEDNLKNNIRVACLAIIEGEAEIEVLKDDVKIVSEVFKETDYPLSPRPFDKKTKRALGIAIDFGTTTVAMSILDLLSGKELRRISFFSPQRIYGDDVITRMSYSIGGGREDLKKKTIRHLWNEMERAIKETNTSMDEIYDVVITGNTPVIHLLLGWDVYKLSRAPYIPLIKDEVNLSAEDVGFKFLKKAKVYIPPIISGYIGSDIVAGLISTRCCELKGSQLFVDMGTNGEIVLKNKDEIFATSVAAGPAFEGVGITFGKKAEKGAIDSFGIKDGKIFFSTIGSSRPKGICGSGLIDLISILLKENYLSRDGKWTNKVKDFVGKDKCFIICNEEKIYLTQTDVRNIQLAKAAFFSGIKLLLKNASIVMEEISGITIAGGFGLYVSPSSLVEIKMIPNYPEDKIIFAGNTSLSGARIFLKNISARKEARNLISKIKVIELTENDDFQNVYIESLSF